LQAVAHAGGMSASTVSLLPAGRGEVFAQMFSVSEDGKVLERDSAAHLSPQALLARYAGLKSLKWAGNGAHLHRSLLSKYADEQGIRFFEDPIEEKKTEPGAGI